MSTEATTTIRRSLPAGPHWWESRDLSVWDTVKAALCADWTRSKQDLKMEDAKLEQSALDTVNQMLGRQKVPEQSRDELALQFGVSAKRHHTSSGLNWSEETLAGLKADWDSTFPEHPFSEVEDTVNYAYHYRYYAD